MGVSKKMVVTKKKLSEKNKSVSEEEIKKLIFKSIDALNLIQPPGSILQKVNNRINLSSTNFPLSTVYRRVLPFDTSIICRSNNPTLQFSINVNYLTSVMPDNQIILKLSYLNKFGQKTTFAENILGNKITTLHKNTYHYTDYIDVTSNIGDKFTFILDASHSYNPFQNHFINRKPEILLDTLGNYVNIMEISAIV